MSFFSRRKAFILVQELPKIEDTKELLTSKIEFLKQQLRLSRDSISKQGLVTPEFAKSMLFWLDFQEKISNSLIHLINSSSLSWTFLQTFKVKENKSYIFGELTKSGFLLDTEAIFRDIDNYFFNLLKLGSINIKTWALLKKLKALVNNESVLYLNDDHYYKCKFVEIIEPLEKLTEFDKLEEEINNFINKPLPLQNEQPVIWNFLNASQKNKNYAKVAEILFNSSYKYEEIRNKPETKAFLSTPQYRELFYCLSQLNSFENLYKVAFELEIHGDKLAIPEVFKFCFLYFLNQNNIALTKDNPISSRYSFYEKIAHAILLVDLILFICKYKINLFSFKSPFKDQVQSKFKEACEVELAGLRDKLVIQSVFVFDLSIMASLVSKIEQLRTIDFYKKHYSRILGPLLSLTW